MPHERMFRELQACLESQEFVEYRVWGDAPDLLLVGRVRSLTATSVVFDDVHPTGAVEGTEAVPLRRIHVLQRDNDYLRRLRRLSELGPQAATLGETVRGEKAILVALQAAIAAGEVVRIHLSATEAWDVLPVALEDEALAFQVIVDPGRPDGQGLVRLSRIVAVSRGDMGTRDLTRLLAQD